MPIARIRLSSTEPEQLTTIIDQIKDIAKRTGVNFSGPIPLPTKRLKVPTRTAPDGRGRELYETWEMRIHKRVIDLAVDERALRLIMRIPMPKDVNVEIEMVE
ncbi:MAG: 30S ribosomal protein S10 [Candidatus Nanoarchaeia archaeon]|nr:30S ribosomal protein S10 [Candidatus Nanoarchaeia archaeon]MDD5239861.1 30S ribosomal protein S10 [Candidatus Nanoarchaeia archaeon]